MSTLDFGARNPSGISTPRAEGGARSAVSGLKRPGYALKTDPGDPRPSVRRPGNRPVRAGKTARLGPLVNPAGGGGMSDAADFVADLLQHGIELVIRNNVLRRWPRKTALTELQQAFVREHEAELKALARAGLTTVSDTNPDTVARAVARLKSYDGPAETTAASAPAHAACPYCNRPCIGADNRWFRVLHWHDPAEVARRNAEATAVMLKQMPFGHGDIS
jgi:hypothetical protein